MYESNIGDPTNISFTANQSKSLAGGKRQSSSFGPKPEILLEWRWVKKDPSAAGELS
jgi:hypothetical protein